MSEWSNLPNAAHIDRVLAHAKANPDKWNAAWGAALEAAHDAARDAAYDTAWDAAWDAARGSAWNAAWGAAWGAAREAAYNAAWDAAWDACAALIAWDEAGDLLDQPVSLVRSLAQEKVHAAVLLLPAVIAMEVENERVE